MARLDERRLAALIAAKFGVGIIGRLFEHEHLSHVVGLLLTDGREVVVKARPFDPRHLSCTRAQRALYFAGFPCARPLCDPLESGDEAVSIEEFVPPPGSVREYSAPNAAASARAFRRMLFLASSVWQVSNFSPPPAWLDWDHAGSALWPAPDDGPEDLNAISAPGWLTDAAGQLRQVLRSHTGLPIVGHGAWEARNVFWDGDRLAVVHDWDSLAALPEAALVGAAAGVFAVVGSAPGWPSLYDSKGFLAGYLDAREELWRAGEPLDAWTAADDRVFWAAGLWVHLFNAQKAIARGTFGPDAERVRQRVRERLPLTAG
ncbi:MAG: hypothetical protein QM619_03265 [Micropruina sp.]|uniref:hypothetical protein n=1 Tax=Micropruina sp. TaxID=2737536 RepID=UPI0039E63449